MFVSLWFGSWFAIRGILSESRDETIHLIVIAINALQEFYLGSCAHEVMLWIFHFIISVAVDIICKEPYSLHIRQHLGSERKQRAFYLSKE